MNVLVFIQHGSINNHVPASTEVHPLPFLPLANSPFFASTHQLLWTSFPLSR